MVLKTSICAKFVNLRSLQQFPKIYLEKNPTKTEQENHFQTLSFLDTGLVIM